jgi:hypothetical protein
MNEVIVDAAGDGAAELGQRDVTLISKLPMARL